MSTNNYRITIPCPHCKVSHPTGLYTTKFTEDDPLMQRLYCPHCKQGFFFADLGEAVNYED